MGGCGFAIGFLGTEPANRALLMSFHKSLLWVLLALSSACIDIPDIEYVDPEEAGPDAGVPPAQSVDSGTVEPETPDAGVTLDAGVTPDAGTEVADAGDSGTTGPGPSDGGEPPVLTVTWGAPAETVFTNGIVAVAVSVTGDTPELVELLLDGAPLVALVPPYTHQWDTASLPERSYSLVARASKAGRIFNSTARTVVVDRTPPQVVSRSPAPGAQKVSVRQVIQAVFSEPVRPATISAASVRLTSGSSEVSCSRVLASDGVTLEVSLSAPISVPAALTLRLTAEVVDLAGNPLWEPSDTWSWALPAFLPVGPALRVIQEAPGAYAPSIQLDAQGRPWVVWMESWSNGTAIRVSRWNGNAWELVGGALNATGEYPINTSAPALRLDAAGRPVVAWSDSRYIYVDRWNGTTAWTRIARLSASSGVPNAVTPTLEVDGQGRLIVAWSEGIDGAASIHVWRREDGGNWEDLGTLGAFPGTTTPSEAPVSQLDRDGFPVVAWLEQGDSMEESIHVRRWNGSNWEPYGGALSADAGRTDVRVVSLRLDLGGRPMVTWVQAGKTYMRRWNVSSWAPLGGALHAGQNVMTTFSSAVDMDAAGSPVVASVATVNGDASTHLLVQRWDGEQWVSLGGALSANPGRTSVNYIFSLARDRDGYPVLAWSEFDGSASSVYVYAYNH